jgi:DNA-binding transcriptional regulator YiaG
MTARPPGLYATPTPDNVLRLRQDFKLSQQDLADLVFLGWQTVSNWENGRTACSPAYWQLIRAKLAHRYVPFCLTSILDESTP